MNAMSELLDRLHQWWWGYPNCTPGYCFCRRGCAQMLNGDLGKVP